MDGINHVSLMLGEIRSDMKAVKETLAEVRNEQGYAGIVRNEMANQLQTIPGLSGRIDAVEKLTAAHEQLRQRGVGVVAVLAIAFGILGHLIWIVVDWVLKR